MNEPICITCRVAVGEGWCHRCRTARAERRSDGHAALNDIARADDEWFALVLGDDWREEHLDEMVARADAMLTTDRLPQSVVDRLLHCDRVYSIPVSRTIMRFRYALAMTQGARGGIQVGTLADLDALLWDDRTDYSELAIFIQDHSPDLWVEVIAAMLPSTTDLPDHWNRDR